MAKRSLLVFMDFVWSNSILKPMYKSAPNVRFLSIQREGGAGVETSWARATRAHPGLLEQLAVPLHQSRSVPISQPFQVTTTTMHQCDTCCHLSQHCITVHSSTLVLT